MNSWDLSGRKTKNMNRTTRTQLVGIEFHWIQFRMGCDCAAVRSVCCCSCLIQCDAQYPHLYTGYLIDLNTQVFIFWCYFFFPQPLTLILDVAMAILLVCLEK